MVQRSAPSLPTLPPICHASLRPQTARRPAGGDAEAGQAGAVDRQAPDEEGAEDPGMVPAAGHRVVGRPGLRGLPLPVHVMISLLGIKRVLRRLFDARLIVRATTAC